MFKISDDKTDESRLLGFMYLMRYRRLERCVRTCYLPDSAEHLQLFGIQRWNLVKIISVGEKTKQNEKKKAQHETTHSVV